MIEMVIVILIMGIIAAVTAPRLFDTASRAEKNSTRQQLAILRNALEMYRAQEGGYPTVANISTRLVPYFNGPLPVPQYGTARGKVGFVDGGNDPTAPMTTDVNADAGWAYRPADGRIVLNVANTDEAFDW